MLPSGQTLPECLEERGVSRRAFLNFCGVMAATLALPASYRTQIAEALAKVDRPVVIWRQFQDCAGNSESILRSPHPDVAEIVLETLAWNYHELIMAGSGEQAEAMSSQAVRDLKGQYLAIIEGAIPPDGGYCTIGGRSALDIAREVVGNAKATLAVGACAWDGGLVQHGPTGGQGVQDMVPGGNVVNLGGCPHNPANTVAVLVHYLTFGQMPELDQYNRPLFAYGDLIHDQCERRAYFDAGLFVEAWGDEGHRKGYCLYKMGCKGPSATYNCPNVRWNDGTSWPIEAGPHLHRLRFARFLGLDEPVLRATAERARGSAPIRPRRPSASPSSAALPRSPPRTRSARACRRGCFEAAQPTATVDASGQPVDVLHPGARMQTEAARQPTRRTGEPARLRSGAEKPKPGGDG